MEKKILFSAEDIQTRVESLAIEMSYRDNPNNEPIVVICVLNGAFMFFADIVKHLKVNCEVDFMQTKSYIEGKQQEEVKLIKDATVSLKGKRVYVIDDIWDSGNTMRTLVNHLKHYDPSSITPVVLFKKEFVEEESLMWGFELATNLFIWGYGLDREDGYGRNYSCVFGKEVN